MRLAPADVMARLKAWLADHSDASLAQRVASTAFLIRVAAAGIGYFSQVLLARWMGSFEFGIFVYVWTWVMVIGGAVDLGLASSAQRFIPDYRENRADRETARLPLRQPLARFRAGGGRRASSARAA